MMKPLYSVLLCVVLVLPASAQQAVPSLTGRVVDRAELLSRQTEETLTTMLAQHEAATSNQVAVLTVRSLEGEAIESFSLRVAQAWALGTAEQDNGVLLVVAEQDRELRIEVGYGLEGSLPDVVAGRIIRNEIVPYFREGDYEGGVLVGVQRILGAIEGTYTPEEVSSEELPPVWFGLIFISIPSLFLIFAFFMSGCMRWFMFLFLTPFYAVGGLAITQSVIGMLFFLAAYAVLFIGGGYLPRVRAIREKVRKAQKTGDTVKIGPFSVSSSSGSSGGGWSSGGWSSGGGSSFSGGGGSFGGGGSSGSW